jgi:hypothetical protein
MQQPHQRTTGPWIPGNFFSRRKEPVFAQNENAGATSKEKELYLKEEHPSKSEEENYVDFKRKDSDHSSQPHILSLITKTSTHVSRAHKKGNLIFNKKKGQFIKVSPSYLK